MLYYFALYLFRIYAVAQLVEVLRYKPEGCGFDSRGILPGGKNSPCVGLTNLPPLCADFLKKSGVSISWNPKGPPRSVVGKLT
jgi:hypothetical protein